MSICLDALSIIIYSIFFCLCPLHTANFTVNNNNNKNINNKIAAVADEEKGRKTQENTCGTHGSMPRLPDRRCCRGPVYVHRIERAEPPKHRSAATLLQGAAGTRSGLTMRCKSDRRCASARDKTKQKTRGRTS
jgi:hypothetical protein